MREEFLRIAITGVWAHLQPTSTLFKMQRSQCPALATIWWLEKHSVRSHTAKLYRCNSHLSNPLVWVTRHFLRTFNAVWNLKTEATTHDLQLWEISLRVEIQYRPPEPRCNTFVSLPSWVVRVRLRQGTIIKLSSTEALSPMTISMKVERINKIWKWRGKYTRTEALSGALVAICRVNSLLVSLKMLWFLPQ